MKSIVSFFYEIAQLKYLRRNGEYRAWIKDPETIAEHVLVATQIAYVMAELEGADRGKVLEMVLFHDNGEARVSDHDKVLARYIRKDEGERTAFIEQIMNIPENLKNRLVDPYDERKDSETLEAKIAKDADYLECAIQYSIHVSNGNPHAQNWINNIGKALRTES